MDDEPEPSSYCEPEPPYYEPEPPYYEPEPSFLYDEPKSLRSRSRTSRSCHRLPNLIVVVHHDQLQQSRLLLQLFQLFVHPYEPCLRLPLVSWPRETIQTRFGGTCLLY